MQAFAHSTLYTLSDDPSFVGPLRPYKFQTGGYRLKVYTYPCGVVEATACFVPEQSRPAVEALSSGRSEDEVQRRATDNERRATARAKASVRRLCLAAGMDRLLTLTYRENMTDQAQGWRDFRKFALRMREHYPKWRYVAVMELQKRGAVHFHLAVRGFQDVGCLRVTWRSVIGEGNIDVTPPRGNRNPAARAASCARYLTKYMLKHAMSSEFHRYRSSHIDIPLEVIRLESLNALQAGNEALARVLADGRMLGGGSGGGIFFDAQFGLTWAVGWVP